MVPLMRLGSFLAILAASSVGVGSDTDPQLSRELKVERSATPLSLPSAQPKPKLAFAAVVRINSPSIHYSSWFDGFVPGDMRDRLYFKGMHLIYPNLRVLRELPDVVLNRQRDLRRKIRIPVEPKLILKRPGQPPTRLTVKQLRDLAKRMTAIEKAALAKLVKPDVAPLPKPIVAVWGLRQENGKPGQRLVLYANGLVNDPGGKTTWSWTRQQLTVDFPDKEPVRFTVSPDGRTLAGRWHDGTQLQGRMLGYSESRKMPVLSMWHIQNVKGPLSTINLYANGKSNDQHSKSTWSWNDGILTIDGGKTAQFAVTSDGRTLKGRWRKQDNIVATLFNPIVGFEPAPSQKARRPQLYATLDRSTLDYCKLLVRHVPKDRLPPAAVVGFFTKRVNDANFRIVPVSETSVEFQIVAPTVKQAEMLARGLMAIYDYGTLIPIRKSLNARVRDVQKEYEARKAVVWTLKKELAAMLNLPEPPPPLDEETIARLKIQRQTLTVEIAGLQARIEKAAVLLKTENRKKSATAANLKSIKLQAEIELAGTSAKRKKIDELTSRAAALRDYKTRTKASRSRLGRPEYLVGKSGRILGAYGHVVRKYAALRVVGQKITIRPVRWRGGR